MKGNGGEGEGEVIFMSKNLRIWEKSSNFVR